MTSYSKATIADFVDGKLHWHALKEMMSNFKDPDRFDKYVAVLQERASWPEKILLPLGPHLFIVKKADGSIVVKSSSGYEFGDYRRNWKLKARIFVRDTENFTARSIPHSCMRIRSGWRCASIMTQSTARFSRSRWCPRAIRSCTPFSPISKASTATG